MSHFIVLVVGNDVDDLLAPFDESMEMPEYKRGVVSDKDIKDFIEYYTKDIKEKDPKRTAEATANCKLPFEKLYKKYGNDWNGNKWHKDEHGVMCEYSTYNPDSKWDWYETGGRWNGFITLKAKGKKKPKQVNTALKKDIDWSKTGIPFALLIDGEWHESGQMGWFGCSAHDKSETVWKAQVMQLLKDVPGNETITAVDCHI